MSDVGRLQRPSGEVAQSAVEVDRQEAVPAGSGMDHVLAERKLAVDEARFRMTDGRAGAPPMSRIIAQRQRAAADAVRRAAVARKAFGPAANAPIPQSGGNLLPADLRGRFERKLGADLGDVRVHTEGESATAATELGARAFTVGSDVHFNAGEFAPGTKEGDRLLAHELTHVVQGQRSGIQRKADEPSERDAAAAEQQVSQPGEPAEQEADAVADQVADELHEGGEAAFADAQAPGAAPAGKPRRGKKKNEPKPADAEASGEAAAAADPRDGDDSDADDGDPKEQAPSIAAKLEGVGRKVYLAPAQATGIAAANPQAPDPAVDEPSIDNPLLHPYLPTFKARVAALGASGQVAPLGDTNALAEQIWLKICNAVKAARPSMQDPAAYANFARGWLNLSSPQFQTAIAQFDRIGSELAKLSSAQFTKASNFGFWSGPEGRLLAEACSDLTLETSGIGALFDALPTLDGKRAGWDPELWGGLSRAYASAVAQQVVRGKQARVCLGANARPDNIWGAVESIALEKGLAGTGLKLEDVTTYVGAAAKTKDKSALDTTKKAGNIVGAVYAGKDRNAAVKAATDHYDALTA